MPAIPLYTVSEQPNVMNGAIIITLSNQFVTDLNNDALREQTLDKLHRHINSVSQSLHRMCIIQYPSGVFTNDKGHKIDTPTIVSLIPLCTVSKEEDESVNIVIFDHIFQDQEKSKLDKLHAFRIAIKAKLSGKNAVPELEEFEGRRKEKALLVHRAAISEEQKKRLNKRKLGLATILIGFGLLAAAGAILIFFPPVGVSVIMTLLTIFLIVSSVFSFVIGGDLFSKGYGYNFMDFLEVSLPRSTKTHTGETPGAIYHVETKSSSEKTLPQVPPIIASANPGESNTIVKSSDVPENVAKASSKAPKTGHKT